MTDLKHTDNITEDLLRVYELSLATGNGCNPVETCRHFIKILVTRYNLTGASVWWRHYQKHTFEPLAVLPNMHQERFDQSLAALVARSLDEEPSGILEKNGEIYKRVADYFDTPSEAIAIRPIADRGALLFHTASRDVITPRMLSSLRPVLRALGTSLIGGFASEALIQSQRLLSEQRGFLKTLFQTLPALIWLKGPDGIYLACNKRFEQFLGAPESEIVGKTDYHFLDHELADFFRRQDIKAMFSESPMISEVSLTFASDGHKEQLEVTKIKMHDDKGKVVGVLGIGHDITERIVAESKLRDSEASFRSLFESVQEAVCVQDKNGNFIAVNDGAARMYGREKSWFEGKAPVDVAAPEMNDLDVLRPTLAKALAGKPQSFEFWDIRADGTPFPKEVHQTLGSWFGKPVVFAVATDISERKRTAEQLEHWANFDELTDLPNRRLLLDRLRKVNYNCSRHHQIAAVLFIDLDNFKHVNDSLGHLVGDGLLKAVGLRLQDMVHGGNMAARLGGDEFVFLLTDLPHNTTEAVEQVRNTAEDIRQNLSEPYQVGDHILYSTCSIGVTMMPLEDEDAYDILKHADTAMYRAKETCRNTVRFYMPSMQLAAEERLLTQNDLQQAIQSQAFALHFQPQVSANMKIVGAEALLLWQHPEKGLISPSKFIPVAEQSGQILTIGRWLIEQALQQMKQWVHLFKDTHFRRLSLNISSKQFLQMDFVDKIKHMLAETGVPPGMLNLELTESVLIEDFENSTEKIKSLKDIGVKFAIDDFGTGYSSLSYLKRLPIDEIKIDRSFVREVTTDEDDANLVKIIIAMSKTLNLRLVAEGVETEQQFRFLRENGCDVFQGFYFGKPMSKEQYQLWQTDQNWTHSPE